MFISRSFTLLLPNPGAMLGQRLRRWPIIVPGLGEVSLFRCFFFPIIFGNFSIKKFRTVLWFSRIDDRPFVKYEIARLKQLDTIDVIESVTDSELELPLYLMMRNSLDEDLPEDLDQQYMYCTSKTEQGTPTYSDSHHNNSEINTKIHVRKTCYGRVLSFDWWTVNKRV